MRQREIRIKLNCILEMLNGRRTVFRGNTAKDEPSKRVPTSQILFVSGGAFCCRFGNSHLLGRTKLQAQSLDDTLRDRILHGNDVSGRSIDAVAPEYVSGTDVKQLRGHSKSLAGMNEPGCQ